MDSDTIRIVRPWGRLGRRYEVGTGGFRYYCFAWIASLTGIASIPLHALGVLPTSIWLTFFLVAFALTNYLTWQTTRHGRKIPE